ncbi:MAG: hypothetical protein OXC25_09785 [Thiotrichales bacterium]|nr:hypothetical protein [Thiotrichales bacterium]MCY4286822.1 hypothetical protein [Thiotrichales bacterium]MCY4350122.1 hypothetical protein [Thiotrichales bacterium]
MTTQTRRPTPHKIAISHLSYQPSKAGLEEDMRVDATFDEAVAALARPVKKHYVKPTNKVRAK